MTRSLRSAARGEQGQSLVEVALMLPVLLLIVLGIVDVGRVYAYKVAVTNAAREAAIHAARDPQATADLICQRALDELGVGAAVTPCATAAVTVTCLRGASPCGNDTSSPTPLYQTVGESGADVTVTVRYDISLLTGYLVGRAFAVNPVALRSTAHFVGLSE